MAKRVVEYLTDDIDGGEAAESIRFSLGDDFYEIDLNPGNASRLREAFQEWISHASSIPPPGAKSAAAFVAAQSARNGSPSTRSRSRSRAADPELNAQVRAWAAAHNYQIAEHGRIPVEVLLAWASRTE